MICSCRNLLFFIFLFYSYFSFGFYQNYESETCTEPNKGGKYTNSILEELEPFEDKCDPKDLPQEAVTEASMNCFHCAVSRLNEFATKDLLDVFETSQLLTTLTEYTMCLKRDSSAEGDIAPVCFYAGMLRSANAVRTNYECNSKNQGNPNVVRGGNGQPCFTENYVNETARAFNKMTSCFGLSDEEKQNAFATLNRESAFTLNARSATKARCYGQITMPRFKDLNKYIYFDKEKTWSLYHNVYKEAKDNCPDIDKKIIPKDLMPKSQSSKSSRTIKKLEEDSEKAPMTCSLTRDPYSCMFYSLYNLKISMVEFDRWFENPPDLEMSEELEKDFGNIERNKMMLIQGPIVRTRPARKETVTWLMADDNEVHHVFQVNRTGYNSVTLKRTTVEVFDKDDLRRHFVHTAHNGGNSIANDHFVTFMRKFKRKVSKSSCNKDATCRGYRQAIAKGEKLGLEVLRKEWEKYSRLTSLNSESRRFMTNIDQNMIDIQNSDQIKRNLRKLLAPQKQTEELNGETARFERELAGKCSFMKKFPKIAVN